VRQANTQKTEMNCGCDTRKETMYEQAPAWLWDMAVIVVVVGVAAYLKLGTELVKK
jgi:hypothetical protein